MRALALVLLLSGCGKVGADIMQYRLDETLMAFEIDAATRLVPTLPITYIGISEHNCDVIADNPYGCCIGTKIFVTNAAFSLGLQSLAALVYHEAGHCGLGLGHWTDPDAIMYPTISNDDTAWTARWKHAVSQELSKNVGP